MHKEWFTIEEIDSKTFAISEYGHWERFHSYLLIDQHEACLIDSGLGIGNIKAECQKITDNPIKVITTHVHWDHIGGHKDFQEIYVHKDDAQWLEYGIPIPLSLVKENLMKEPFTLPQPRDFDLNNYELYRGKPARELSDEDLVQVGTRKLKIMHTPGHSPGHICIFEKESGYLFSGDLIYQGTLFAFFDSTDPVSYARSVEKVAQTEGIKKIFPSHNEIGLSTSFLHQVNTAFKRLALEGKLIHGSGIHKFDDFAIRI